MKLQAKHVLIGKLSLAAIAVVASLLLAWYATQNTSRAADISKFDPGNILSDAVMSNKSSMSVQDISSFLNSKNPCNNTKTYMASWYPNMQYNIRDGKFVCMAQDSFNGKSAAQIIWQAAQDYNINPQFLIVLLEKEQGLVTDTWPNHIQYRSATGYGCPDTAACDSQYFGLENQVRQAANLFHKVLDGGWSNYPVGQTYVQYHPDASCGGSIINIQNRATSALYRYTPYQPNQSALSAGYSLGDSCGAYGNRNTWLLFNDWFGNSQYEPTILSYRSHIGYYGWTGLANGSGVTGFTGQSKSMQAIEISGEVSYSTYSLDRGWQPEVTNGMISGTTELNRPIQAIKIKLSESLSNQYDIFYRAHVSYVGWMGWTSNGQPSGVTGGANNNIEALELKLVRKGYSTPDNSTGSSYQNISTAQDPAPLVTTVSSHVSNAGWQNSVTDEMTSGLPGRNGLEAIKIQLANHTGFAGNIKYSTHVAFEGWQDWKKDGDISGTTGKSRAIESVRILLTDELSSKYDIWYRVYLQDRGWLGWSKNGQPSGAVGLSKRIEAVQLRLSSKNSINLSSTNNFINHSGTPVPEEYSIVYSSHVSFSGWNDPKPQGSVSGTTGMSRAIEAIKINAIGSEYGTLGVNCLAKPLQGDWLDSVQPKNICGTTGMSKPLESIKLSLDGIAAQNYDIQYRAHVAFLGWQDWRTNGEIAGGVSNRQIEAIIIRLVKK